MMILEQGLLKNTLIRNLFFTTLAITFLLGCGSDDTDQENPKQPTNRITSFQFLASDNEALEVDITAEINHETKIVSAVLPSGTTIRRLIPNIIVENDLRVFPDPEIARNFEREVTYEISADIGSSTEYTIVVSLEPGTDSSIRSFRFFVSDNDGVLTENVIAKINEDTKVITAEFKSGTILDRLKPTIEIATGAGITPESSTTQNFNNEIKYTVIAENGNTSIYTVQATVEKSSDKQMIRFEILNTLSGTRYTGTIDEYKKEVTLALPENINFDFLEFNITISEGATSTVDGGSNVDFSDIVDFTVTAEDGSSAVYAVNVYRMNTLRSDKAALIDFYNARSLVNPLALASWSRDDISEWQGVTIENERVTKLSVFDLNLFMKAVPASIGDLTKLTTLSLESISLEEIPIEIGNLKELQILDLSGNSLTEIPNEIGEFTKLQMLDLSNNLLKSIPDEIGNLTELWFQFDLSNNVLETIPNTIGKLTKLNFCDLSDNSLKTIPENTLGKLVGLISLDISNNKDLESIPSDVWTLTNLDTLNVSNTALNKIPDDLWLLMGLDKLDLSSNLLKEIPSDIKLLNDLKELNLSNNDLENIPGEIGMLDDLTALNISNNPLTIIPREICDLIEDALNFRFEKDENDSCEL